MLMGWMLNVYYSQKQWILDDTFVDQTVKQVSLRYFGVYCLYKRLGFGSLRSIRFVFLNRAAGHAPGHCYCNKMKRKRIGTLVQCKDRVLWVPTPWRLSICRSILRHFGKVLLRMRKLTLWNKCHFSFW